MKNQSMLCMMALLFFVSKQSLCQKSASGYILFGKNKSEIGVICTNQGICRLQTAYDEPESAPVLFTAIPLSQDGDNYQVVMTLNVDTLVDRQPGQKEYFINATEPYVIDDKFVFPSWLLKAMGFNAALNRQLTINGPFSLGVPPQGNEEGEITLVLTPKIRIK